MYLNQKRQTLPAIRHLFQHTRYIRSTVYQNTDWMSSTYWPL